jgi:hypothetical protein
MVDCNTYDFSLPGASHASDSNETAIDSAHARRLLSVAVDFPPGTYFNRFFGTGEQAVFFFF